MTDVLNACPQAQSDLTRLIELDPELLRCPFPLYEQLRTQAPVMFNERLNAWVVSRHDDIVEVLRDTETFSSAAASGASSTNGIAQRIVDDPASPEPLRQQALRRLRLAKSPVLLFTDPPLHKRQRLLVSAAFHPRRVKQLEPEVRRLSHELIDGFAARGEVELVQEFSLHLPMTIIASMIGVPAEMYATFKRWSNAFTAGTGSLDQPPEALADIFSAVDEFYDYFTEQIQARQAEPRDDLLTDLVTAREDGEEALTIDEMLQMLVQFLVAGNETTTNMLTGLMHRLAADPELQDRVRADVSMVKPLVEEGLRLESPVQGMFRSTTRDTVVGGQPIPAGSNVWLVYASANRDAGVFDNPDDIDLEAERPPHLAFSRGEHFCLGANIAKLELNVGLEILLDRLHDIRLADESADVTYHRSFILRGIAQLPLRFTPSG